MRTNQDPVAVLGLPLTLSCPYINYVLACMGKKKDNLVSTSSCKHAATLCLFFKWSHLFLACWARPSPADPLFLELFWTQREAREKVNTRSNEHRDARYYCLISIQPRQNVSECFVLRQQKESSNTEKNIIIIRIIINLALYSNI